MVKQRLYLVNTLLSLLGIIFLFGGVFYYLWQVNQLKMLAVKNQALEQALLSVGETDRNYAFIKSSATKLSQLEKAKTSNFFSTLRKFLKDTSLVNLFSGLEINQNAAKITAQFDTLDKINVFLTATSELPYQTVVLDSLEKKDDFYEAVIVFNK